MLEKNNIQLKLRHWLHNPGCERTRERRQRVRRQLIADSEKGLRIGASRLEA
jgi:hypothetical protein